MLSPDRRRLLPLAVLAAGCAPKIESAAPRSQTTVEATADEAPAREQIVEVVAGTESTCARTKSGRVACIGQAMSYSEKRPAIDTHIPRVVDVPPSKAISAGTGFACSLDREGGRVRCWGHNGYKELGRETLSEFDYWALPVPNLEDIEQISSLGETTCARRGPHVTCWPHTADEPYYKLDLQGSHPAPRLQLRTGELGRDAYQLMFADESVPGRRPFLSELGRDRSTTLPTSHSPWEDASARWCERDDGTGFTCRGSTEQQFASVDWMEVGLGHGCAPFSGHVACAGDNSVGQAPSEPVALSAPVADIAVGAEHSCAVTADGRLYCWGSSLRGQTGLSPARTRPPRVVARDVARVWTTGNATCLETEDGAFACAGANEDWCDTPQFSELAGPTGIREVFEARGELGCIVDRMGSIWCLVAGAWIQEVDASQVSTGAVTPSEFAAPHGGELCWLRGGHAECAMWSFAATNVPLEHASGVGLSTRTEPFGARTGLVRLEAIGDALCGLSTDDMMVCADKVYRRGALPIWVAVEAPARPILHFARDAVVFTDGTAAGLASLHVDKTDGSQPLVAYTTLLRAAKNVDDATQAAGDCVLRGGGELRCDDEEKAWISGESFVSLESAERHACAIDEKQRLWCWGDGVSGQLGDGEAVCTRQRLDISRQFYDAWEATP